MALLHYPNGWVGLDYEGLGGTRWRFIRNLIMVFYLYNNGA